MYLETSIDKPYLNELNSEGEARHQRLLLAKYILEQFERNTEFFLSD